MEQLSCPSSAPLPAAGEMQLPAIRSLQFNLTKITWKHLLLTQSAVHHLCAASGSSVGLCETKPVSGPRTGSNPCDLNCPAGGAMFRNKHWILKGGSVTLCKTHGENKAPKAALGAPSTCCWKRWQDLVQMGWNLYTALFSGPRGQSRD